MQLAQAIGTIAFKNGNSCCMMGMGQTFPVGILLVEETGVPEENHEPTESHRRTLSHNFVPSTPRLSGM
jgi:hypothetical protein